MVSLYTCRQMSSVFAYQQWRPLNTSPNAGGGGSCVASAYEYSCAHHVTWRPNKLWRSTSIFNLYGVIPLHMCLVATLLICNVLLYLLLLYSFYFGVWAPAFYSVRYVLLISPPLFVPFLVLFVLSLVLWNLCSTCLLYEYSTSDWCPTWSSWGTGPGSGSGIKWKAGSGSGTASKWKCGSLRGSFWSIAGSSGKKWVIGSGCGSAPQWKVGAGSGSASEWKAGFGST